MSWLWPDFTDQQQALRATRPAFWASLVVGVLSLFSSTLGLVNTLIFLGIAMGIRAKKLGAATAGLVSAVVILLNAIYLGLAVTTLEFRLTAAISLLIWVGLACLYLRAMKGLTQYSLIQSASPHASKFLPLSWALIPLLVALTRPPLLVSLFVIPTGAMEDTLLIGDHIVVERVSGWLGMPPRRGDIVVIRYPVDPTQTFLKRVVGIPGDRIQLVNKQLRINGISMVEPYVTHKSDYIAPYRDTFPTTPNGQIFPQAEMMLAENVADGELVVPDGSYFVLGDNRDHSLDSRYWGFIEQDDILGSPLFIYWSDTGERDEDGNDISDVRTDRIYKRIRPHDLSLPATN